MERATYSGCIKMNASSRKHWNGIFKYDQFVRWKIKQYSQKKQHMKGHGGIKSMCRGHGKSFVVILEHKTDYSKMEKDQKVVWFHRQKRIWLQYSE